MPVSLANTKLSKNKLNKYRQKYRQRYAVTLQKTSAQLTTAKLETNA
jgi:hypothetical protein